MNEEIKKQWVAALRSGEYQQGHRALRREDKFCCLGVLCDLHAKAGLGEWEGPVEGYRTTIEFRYDYLPIAVQEWAGLDQSSPIVNGLMLSEYNDGAAEREYIPLPFPRIADLIERHL